MCVRSTSVTSCQLMGEKRSLSTGWPHRLSSCGPGSTRPPVAALSTATNAAISSAVGSPLTTVISSTACVGGSSIVIARMSLTSVMSCSCWLLTAVRSFARSQWNVPVLLGRRLGDLAFQQPQGGGHVAAGVRRRDDSVDIAALGGDVRVHQGVLVVLLQFQSQCV